MKAKPDMTEPVRSNQPPSAPEPSLASLPPEEPAFANSKALKSNRPVIIFLGLALLLTVLFTGLTAATLSGGLNGFDQRLEPRIDDLTFAGSQKLFDVLGYLSKPVIIFGILVLTLAILLWRKLTWAAGLVLLAAAGGALLSVVLKNIFQRVRPGVDLSEGIYSYPSGHAMYATCFFGILIYVGWLVLPSVWLRVVWSMAMAGLIVGLGLSRIYFALHYPTDVIGGFLTGGIYICLVISFHQFLGWTKPAFRAKFRLS